MKSRNHKPLLSAFKRLEQGFAKDALDLGSELLKSQSLGDQAEGHMCCGTAYEQGGMTSRSISTRRCWSMTAGRMVSSGSCTRTEDAATKR